VVSACFCVCGLFTPAAGAGIRSVPSLTARVVSHARAVNRRSVLLNGFGGRLVLNHPAVRAELPAVWNHL